MRSYSQRSSKKRHKSKKIPRICPYCKNTWTTRKTDTHRPYCSEKCAKSSSKNSIRKRTIKKIFKYFV